MQPESESVYKRQQINSLCCRVNLLLVVPKMTVVLPHPMPFYPTPTHARIKPS